MQIPRGSEQKEDVLASPDAEDGDEFVDAPSEPEDVDDEDLRVYTHEEGKFDPDDLRKPPRRSSTKSFVTASSVPNTDDDDETDSAEPQQGTSAQGGEGSAQASGLQIPTDGRGSSQKAQGKRPLSDATSHAASESPVGGTSVDAGSTSSLLHRADADKALPEAEADSKPPARGILSRVKKGSHLRSSTSGQLAGDATDGNDLTRRKSNLRNLVKFDIPEDSRRATLHLKAKKAQMTVQRAGTKIRRQRIKDGIVVKMERMLVRVDAAGEVPDDFDENVNQRVISRVKDKWREYMIVCRHSHRDDAEFVLQFYQTRVRSIPYIIKVVTLIPSRSFQKSKTRALARKLPTKYR